MKSKTKMRWVFWSPPKVSSNKNDNHNNELLVVCNLSQIMKFFENIPTHNHRKRTKQKDVKMTTKSGV